MSQKMILSTRLMDLISNTLDVKITNKEKEVFKAKVNIFTPTNIDNSNTHLKNVDAPDWGNYFDIREGNVSYHAGEQELLEDNRWARKGRQVCKVSKLLHHLVFQSEVMMSPVVEDDEIRIKIISRFVELLSTEISCSKSNVEILVSDDPRDIYTTDTAYGGCGTLGSSCMRPESEYNCHDHSGFYNKMGAHIAYTLSSTGKLTARALLWKGCETRDEETFNFMDRIYGTEEAVVNFKEWAHENGFAHKVDQSASDSTLIRPDGSTLDTFSYERSAFWDSGYPYADTLQHCVNDHDGVITLDTDRGDFSLMETSVQTDDYSSCNECGESNCDDNMHEIGGEFYCENCCSYSEYHGRYVIDSDSVYSSYHECRLDDEDAVCTVDGNWFHENDEDVLIVRVNGGWYEKSSNDITLCEYSDEWYLTEDVHYYNELEQDVCDDCIDDAMEDAGYVSIDGEWYAKNDDEVHLINGTYYHENSNDIIQCDHCEEWFVTADVIHYPEIYKNVCKECLVDAMAEENYVLTDGLWVEVEEIVEVEEVA